MITGIYKITNPDGCIYIGQSKDIERRKKEYIKIKKSSQQIRIKNSILKYGFDNHLFEIIEECSIEMLNEREIYWIHELNSFSYNNPKGMNLTMGGIGILTTKPKPKGIDSPRCKKVYQYNLEGGFIKEWFSIKEASINLKCSQGHISSCCLGKKLTIANSRWFHEYKGEIIKEYNYTPKRNFKKVIQLDKEGNIMNTFISIKEAAILTKMHISQIHRHLNKTVQTIRNFTFKYAK